MANGTKGNGRRFSRRAWWAVASTVVAAVILLGLDGWKGHFAAANQTEERSKENKKKIDPVIALVRELGERVRAEDAALEQDAMRCRQGKIVDREICGAAGVEID